MDQIFRHEGGYVDHPSDPGGATNMGITIGTLRDYRGEAVDKNAVRNLTMAEAREIYRRKYWDLISGDELPGGIDLCVMDSAVNSGPSRGARWLQRALGVKADGAIDTVALAAGESTDVTANGCSNLAWAWPQPSIQSIQLAELMRCGLVPLRKPAS